MAGKVDCTHSNNCPAGPHAEWGIDLVATLAGNPGAAVRYDNGVYAMGAGIAHIGDAHGKKCGFGGAHSDFGTWVWIDHGGGVVSKYGHLASISVKDGQQVYVGTKLGTMGSTGDASPKNCSYENYIDFQVRHGGITGPSVEFSTSDAPTRDGDLLICTPDGVSRVAEHGRPLWPYTDPSQTLEANKYHRIDDLRQNWQVVPGQSGCTARAKAQRAPTGVALKKSGKALAASWSKAPAGVNAVRVEFGRYHPSTGWDPARNEKWVDRGPSATSTKFGSLHSKAKYRVRVWFHTAQGWTSPSGWATASAN